MSDRTGLLRGMVQKGVIVPDSGVTLPEGAVVTFRVETLAFTPDEQAEFDAWDRLSDDAWARIDWGEGEIARDSG